MADETFADGTILLESAGRIATVTLNRPQARNALTAAMWAALPEIAARIGGDGTIRAVLVRGAGERAFSGGADIAEFPRVYSDAAAARRYNDLVRAGQAAIRAIACPTIAVIFGACVGGGCALALSCDLRLAAAGARFAIPPARLGLAYPFADLQRLVQLVGPARASDLVFSARPVPAAEALGFGLVDRVLDEAELLTAATEYAAGIAALSPVSIHAAKRMIGAIAQGIPAETPELRALFDASFASDDLAEGVRAFLEKRPPRFD
ncbi:MAG: enoyl-CoA hydratase [Alphaproteobacteria bacterium]|nr:MAG: enoyl-CoA hydratase [Alphaproteobacteria bacterium]